MKGKSKCRNCGEKLETGNYNVQTLPSKRIPKKLAKLIKMGKDKDELLLSNLKHTKFGRFLLRRMDYSNRMKIVCGKCSSVTQVKMSKPAPKFHKSSDTTQMTLDTPSNISKTNLTTSTGSSKRSNKKRRRDKNAGLFFTLSRDTSTDYDNSPKHDDSMMLFQSELGLASTPKTSKPSHSQISTATNLNQLRKSLLKSKSRSEASKPKVASVLDLLSETPKKIP